MTSRTTRYLSQLSVLYKDALRRMGTGGYVGMWVLTTGPVFISRIIALAWITMTSRLIRNLSHLSLLYKDVYKHILLILTTEPMLLTRLIALAYYQANGISTYLPYYKSTQNFYQNGIRTLVMLLIQ